MKTKHVYKICRVRFFSKIDYTLYKWIDGVITNKRKNRCLVPSTLLGESSVSLNFRIN
jgi:hypothetical protein